MRKTVAGALAGALLAAIVIAAPGSSAADGQSKIDAQNRPAMPKKPLGQGYRCPKGNKRGFKARRLIGKRLPRARRLARRNGCSIRVVKRNGKDLVVTADYSPWRINVATRRPGRVTSIQGIG